MPVLLLSGEADPVSNGATQARELGGRLRAAGLDVTARNYPGPRHEVLKETNRDEGPRRARRLAGPSGEAEIGGQSVEML